MIKLTIISRVDELPEIMFQKNIYGKVMKINVTMTGRQKTNLYFLARGRNHPSSQEL